MRRLFSLLTVTGFEHAQHDVRLLDGEVIEDYAAELSGHIRGAITDAPTVLLHPGLIPHARGEHGSRLTGRVQRLPRRFAVTRPGTCQPAGPLIVRFSSGLR
jgi:hypothetical protein